MEVGLPGRRVLVPGAIAVAVCLLVHLAVVFSLTTQERPVIWPLHNDTIHRSGPAADFYAVYHAGENVARGMSPYAMNRDGRTPYFFAFRYLPVVAEAARAMLVLSPETAYRLWVFVLEGVLAALIVVLWRHTRGWRRYFAASCLLLSSPYFLELYMGQFTFAATAFLAFALLASSCVFYVCAALLKTFPLAAGVAFVRTPQWKCLAVTVGVLLLVSVPYFAMHPGDWREFTKANFDVARGVGGGLHSGNFGFAYLLYSVLRDSSVALDWPVFARTLHEFFLIVTAAAVLLSKETRVVLGACAMVLAHFVGYAHVWEHHMSAVVVVGLLLVTSLQKERKALAVCAACSVALALPTPYGLFDTAKIPSVWDPAVHWPRYESYLVLAAKAVPAFALYLACMVTVCRAGFHSPSELVRAARRAPARRPQERR
jgi:hypothetical protein